MEFEGFIYLDVEHPVVAWNVYRGVLLSQSLIAKCNPVGEFLSMAHAGIAIDRNWERFRFEQVLEDHRRRNFPSKISRLRGLFVFDTPESALAVAEDEAWGRPGTHIRTENLTDVGVSTNSSITRLDANWITWMLKLRYSGNQAWETGIHEYWSGVVCPHYNTPIWEQLVDGAVTIWGAELRKRAYEIVAKQAPLSLSLLEISRIAAGLGSDLGHATARITDEGDHQLLSFHIDMQDAHNEKFLNLLGTYVENNPDKINRRDIAVGEKIFATPNFIAYTYVVGS